MKKGRLVDPCLCLMSVDGSGALDLNFTHRASHGDSQGDSHGTFSGLADGMLHVLK